MARARPRHWPHFNMNCAVIGMDGSPNAVHFHEAEKSKFMIKL